MTENSKIRLDFAPAKWIWATGERTLPNTFVCFRKAFTVREDIESAEGYVLAGSRYVMSVNGERVQFGPAPCDPRYEEADPVCLTGKLKPGLNVLGFRVVYFGHGDGTWMMGKPGLIYSILIKYKDGSEERIISDENTLFVYDESRPAGQYKRWYLRALQEEYDARKDVIGFDCADFAAEGIFEPSRVLRGRTDKPSASNGGKDYLYGSSAVRPTKNAIFARTIPMPEEEFIPAKELYHADIVTWKRDPENWFRFRQPDSFEIREGLEVRVCGDAYEFDMPETGAAAITLKMPEEACGFIDFTVNAPEGTVIEAMVQEGHDKKNTLWLDTQFYAWTRFICREGENHFVSFDYECFNYLQLHVRNAKGKIKISRAGILRRTYPVRNAHIKVEDNDIQAVLDAAVNTLKNSAIETFADGMARERQQYSGDGNHQVTAFSFLYGAHEPLVFRFYDTFGEGFCPDGYYMDCWPAYDRLNRFGQRQIDMAGWGPILDHGVQYVLCTLEYSRQSGDYSVLERNLPDFVKQAETLLGMRDVRGLIPADGDRIPCVWMDHEAFTMQMDGRPAAPLKNRTCAFNLYCAAMLKHGLVPALRHFGMEQEAEKYQSEAENLYRNAVRYYYDAGRGMFIDNLPDLDKEPVLVSDRTLSMALLYDFVPENSENMLKALVEMPEYVSRSYPANAVWRFAALAKFGRCDIITDEIKTRWAGMLSVRQNNTLQEWYNLKNDTEMELSHCPMAPVIAVYAHYAGIRLKEDGYKSFTVAPHMGGLAGVEFTLPTVSGDIEFEYKNGNVTVRFSEGMKGTIILSGKETALESGKAYTLPESQR